MRLKPAQGNTMLFLQRIDNGRRRIAGYGFS